MNTCVHTNVNDRAYMECCDVVLVKKQKCGAGFFF